MNSATLAAIAISARAREMVSTTAGRKRGSSYENGTEIKGIHTGFLLVGPRALAVGAISPGTNLRARAM